MDIRMACDAVVAHAGKPLRYLAGSDFREMAGTAALLLMGALQLPAGSLVIETDNVPGIHGMTGLALRTGIIFHIQEILMDIRMAIGTPYSDVSEIPLFFFLMAGEAGCCQMGAFQRKYPFIVPCDGERCHGKSPGIMAGGTIGCQTQPGKLAPVVILMAISAPVMLDRISIF